jgi:hypothetical protein
MSYDLFFRSRSPAKSISRPDFVRYFGGRKFWEVKGAQAWYSNEDSGVYFSFDYAESDDDRADRSLLPVSFNLNYFRPHPFGLEAEPEVAAFVAQFDLTVSDPQTSGMGDGEYSRDGFLRAWNAGNAFGYAAMVSHNARQEFLILSSARIEASWSWNFSRERRQNEIGDTAFVPRILFFDARGSVRTGVAWPGMPILLPAVDIVIVPRQQLEPRPGFVSSWSRPKDDLIACSWTELEPIVRRFQKASGELVYELFSEVTPADFEQAMGEKRLPNEMKAVTFDHVLDQELIEQARPGQLTSG